ncbi:MAG: hypothetical protein AABY07_01155 [Nanoarchaeota archaeon]
MIKEFLLKRQLNKADPVILILLQSAAEYEKLPYEYVLAVASRETGIRNIIGDHGHGKGVIQIDDRWHEIARRLNPITKPKDFINYGVSLLSANYKWAQKQYPLIKYKWAGVDAWLKIGAASYNTGLIRAQLGAKLGDCDKYTTGKNYGKDVMERMNMFKKLIEK